MTNERLEDYCRNADVSNAKWAIPDKVAVFDLPDPQSDTPYKDFIILFQDGVRVGAILPMGNIDLHMLTLPEHRGKGYMSNFFRTGIFKLLRPKITIVTSCLLRSDENKYYAEIQEKIKNKTAHRIDREDFKQFKADDKERRKIDHIMALSGLKVVYSKGNLSYLEGSTNKIRISVKCPYCEGNNKRAWGSYVSYSSFIKATGATHHIVDYNDYSCMHCRDQFHVVGGILEYPADECHFHTLTGIGYL